jgi:hypothetical protein
MQTIIRTSQRVPWQISAALGWSGLMAAPLIAEVLDRESPANAARHDRSPTCSAVLDAAAVRQLRDTGFVVLDGVLSSAQLHAAREDCAALGMRFADTDQHHKSVRSDQVFWVSEDEGSIWDGRETCEGLLVALRVLRAMPSALLRHGSSGSGRWLGFGSSEGNDLGVPRKGQVARYVAARNTTCMSSAEDSVANNGDSVEAAAASATVVSATGGARYTAHRDGIPSLGSASALLLMSNPSVCMRECTAIIYLTAPSPWLDAHVASQPFRVVDASALDSIEPGALVLYIGASPKDVTGATATQVVEILPVGGRAVLFDSRVVLHEVFPMTRAGVERLAVTVWIGGAYNAAGFVRHLCDWITFKSPAGPAPKSG